MSDVRSSYDSKCFDLAVHFLDVEEIEAGAMRPVKVDAALYARLCSRLAQHIQDNIEDWIEHELPDHLSNKTTPRDR